MKCFYHPDNEAVATCSNCNKGLCSDCTSHLPFCTDCYLAEIRANKRKISNRFGISLLLLIVTMSFCHSHPAFILLYYMFASIPWGMAALDKSPSGFGTKVVVVNLKEPPQWTLGKIFLSIFIGVYVAPFQIYKAVKDYRRYSEILKVNI